MIRTGRQVAQSLNGMVVTPHPLATLAGLDVLREGGTAADAVIAANAVLTVVYFDQTAVGGDALLIYREGKTGALHGLNASGKAAKGVDRERLRAEFGTMPMRGPHSVTVPGTVDAWQRVSERFGVLGLERLLAPAARTAREGFPVSTRVAANLARTLPAWQWDTRFLDTFTPGGNVAKAGERIAFPALADSFDRIAKNPQDFYTGRIAEQIIEAIQSAGGDMTMDDLAEHEPEWVEPVVTTYRGVPYAELGPNCQGITTQIALNMAEIEAAGEFGSAAHLHPLVEAKKRAFHVRDTQLSDPRFVEMDVDRLVSKAHAAELWADYDPTRAAAAGPRREGDTTYLCAVDRDGNMASLIQSIYQNFGSGILAGNSGILLQCRGGYFSLDENHVNRIEGGKRTLHTLMPGMLVGPDGFVGPFGTQGGDAQAQVHMHLVTNLVDHRMDPQQAIEAPRWLQGGATGCEPFTVQLEEGFPEGTADALSALGHDVRHVEKWNPSFGHASMILRDTETGLLRGGADPRSDGLALGY